jgi:hypothetical protein
LKKKPAALLPRPKKWLICSCKFYEKQTTKKKLRNTSKRDIKMLMARTIMITVFSLIISTVPVGLTSWAKTGPVVDHGIYGELLKKHVGAGKVNYAG